MYVVLLRFGLVDGRGQLHLYAYIVAHIDRYMYRSRVPKIKKKIVSFTYDIPNLHRLSSFITFAPFPTRCISTPSFEGAF